ncbi:hypothetical protein [Janthinobacterium sp. SUN137]|uniref:hypothetical protein n=1 Tax=Janthinobacterium sp. SUN137 TaxID=3014789 RepID=UPI00272ECA4A|nr:hypothetical protein [Janthinobacterium sp. SUN137]
MMIISLISILLSIIMAYFYVKKDKIFIFSPAIVFVAYNLFYIIALIIAYYGNVGITLSLLGDKGAINTAVLSSSLALPFFLIGYGYRNSVVIHGPQRTLRLAHLNGFFLCYLFLWLGLMAFGKDLGWHAISHDNAHGWKTVVFAYAKYCFVAMALLFIYLRKSKPREIFFIFVTQVALMMVDGGRTTFFGFLVAAAWIWHQNGGVVKKKHYIFCALALFAILSARAIVLNQNFADAIVGSVGIEAYFASYTLLQSVSIVDNTRHILYGLTYLLDPFIYLLPSGIRDDHLILLKFVGAGNTDELYAPMGGFYYAAEAYANFGVFGPSLVAFFYALLFRYFERQVKYYRFVGIIFIASFSSIASKVNFANGIKVFLVYLLFTLVFRLFFARLVRPIVNERSMAAPTTPALLQ